MTPCTCDTYGACLLCQPQRDAERARTQFSDRPVTVGSAFPHPWTAGRSEVSLDALEADCA